MKMYYENDVDSEILIGKKVAVMGYGSQGRGQARNMADSGVDIIVGLRENGSSWQVAKDDGMNVMTIAEAAKEADIIHILLPDEIQGDVFNESIAPYLESGNTVSFSHGYNILYKFVKVPEDMNVVMIAPKGPGSMVRRTYTEGFGIPGLVAVEQDPSGEALNIALAMAKACGLTRAGVLETTFQEETETDLFGEQAVLCGGITELIRNGFETLVEAGYQPEIAYFETCHEVKLIVDLIYEKGFASMWNDVSNTAEYGGFTRGKRVITEDTKKEMKNILTEIQEGKFTKEWTLENKAGTPILDSLRDIDKKQQINIVGTRLRKACGLEKDE